ncbi:MAG: NADH-quinone oxidoreductase subunit G [Phycisphaerales bacterium]|jgi:NADH-quinone oxidoreductase subunit G
MPTITINGQQCDFEPGERIIDVADRCDIEIPKYCYHPGLSVPAQCRICLAEIWAPNARNDNKLEPMAGGKLMPTCATDATDGMVVYANSPKAVANQKSVMEYLLINHPLDCAICDQAGECTLQDYSYKYGRGVSRFEETKLKQPKKNLGPNVYLYADRCIMCTRCVRFAREIPETGELMIDGRGNKSQIDVFPGVPLANDLSGNVIDLCPVGALLDKDFLFAQRVWFLKKNATIDGLTSSGDNLWAEHNQGRLYRFKPRTNLELNTWWITDEVRYSWKHVHSEARVKSPRRRQNGAAVECEWPKAVLEAIKTMTPAPHDGGGKRLMVVVSPMLASEDAYALATLAMAIDPQAVLAVGPVPTDGEDQSFANPRATKPFVKRAEKAPNARGVRRVLEAVSPGGVLEYAAMLTRLNKDGSDIGAVFLTGNYPSDWATDELKRGVSGRPLVVADLLESWLTEHADVVLPAASWLEQAGSFENADGVIQSYSQAIPTQHESKGLGQLATDLHAVLEGGALTSPKGAYSDFIVDDGAGQVPGASDTVTLPRARLFVAADVRAEMAERHVELRPLVDEIRHPPITGKLEADVQVVEL